MENNNQSKWINTILSELSSKFNNTSESVENCGRECLKSSEGYKRILKLKKSLQGISDDDVIFEAYKKEIYENSLNIQKHGNEILLEYQQCSCGMVKEGDVNDPFLCNCTIGYTKQIFETLFDRPVQVDLLKSILRGDDICKQKITVPIVYRDRE